MRVAMPSSCAGIVTALQTIAARAVDVHLEFLVAGGHAVIVHGHPRTTFDLDLIVRRGDRDAWSELALSLGYRLFTEGPNFLQFNAPDSPSLPLDLMLVSTETFAKLMVDAVSAPAGVAAAKLVSLRHLLALKCHAVKHGHAGRIVKDADDVIRLVQVNLLNLNAPEMRDLFLKHGTEEFYEKVRAACPPH
jgi:hypothetical protein